MPQTRNDTIVDLVPFLPVEEADTASDDQSEGPACRCESEIVQRTLAMFHDRNYDFDWEIEK
jgi:hypothetical protein